MRIRLTTFQDVADKTGDFYRVYWDEGLGGAYSVLVDRVPMIPGSFSNGLGVDQVALDYSEDNSVEDAGSDDRPMGMIELCDKEVLQSADYRFKVEAYDYMGNVQENVTEVTVRVDVAPEPVRGFKMASYDSENDRLTFTYKKSKSFI